MAGKEGSAIRIALITPYLPATRGGNAHTAQRWARFLRAAGHRVAMATDWDGKSADAMIALHARRSHPAIARYVAAHPERPLIVVLTGTDLYRDIRRDADAQASLRLARRLVVLQEQGLAELDPPLRAKTQVIYQSAPALEPRPKSVRTFDVCVAAHLRVEKDPLRAAWASALLPAASRIRILHLGEALDPALATEAELCTRDCPRWHWLGKRMHGETRRRIAASRLLVVSSWMEGGANVICEAITAGVPVLASAVPGNIGMLGVDYAGYYPAGDAAALAGLLGNAETDSGFLGRLREQCAARAPLFDPAREAGAIARLIDELKT